MSTTRRKLAGMTANAAAEYVMDNDIGDLLEDAELIRERRPAKMVTAVRMDLDIQAELEAAAASRGIGVSTLMRTILEDWVRANRTTSEPDQVSELVRYLDAARQVASSLARREAA